MATITCLCPACESTVRSELIPGEELRCPQCSQQMAPIVPDWQDGQLNCCLVCPSDQMFIRKDFPQRLGVTIVCLGFLASSIAWFYHQVLLSFGILFGTAAIDVILYIVMGNLLECYRCHAQYRGLGDIASHGSFNLEVHERFRQEAARLDEAQRPGPAN